MKKLLGFLVVTVIAAALAYLAARGTDATGLTHGH